ncbi:MAG: UTP--glucose-1-phosphate uridylyltransferase [Candidatus Nitronauta litoralis]|uniref:UTP--glucose-1-phosphate uridylyltransferase n=1 Tax=Candidatus Nitronauta litoralis TaxID=2705533 RepID=A0A7T0BZ02_9BACT|nr:MAG: UTP--glucose-1-phosphate uridylyltransferase [Candidatus Nitronauta litoralis]
MIDSNVKKALSELGMPKQALDQYLRLYGKFLSGPSLVQDWSAVCTPDSSHLFPYENLEDPDAGKSTELHKKLVVLKLNGGLGTSMGCQGPKSAIVVKNGKSFLELIGDQVRHLQSKASVALSLMNSFYTHDETLKLVESFFSKIPLTCFQQNRFPRIDEKSLLPLQLESFGENTWYPPGHGDLYCCIEEQGLLDGWLDEGKEVLFVSNADNLGAAVDEKILNHIVKNNIPFLMELTPKTTADLKGGTVYQDQGRLKLLELGNVPPEHVKEFQGMEKFKVFNTNNIWIHLPSLKKRLNEGLMDLPIIANRKTIQGEKVIQLETAVGAGLECFKDSVGLVVSRSRFAPVKTTSDLLRVQSDIYIEREGNLELNPERCLEGLPEVSLNGPLEDTRDFEKRIPVIPGMLELKRLEIEGDVIFKGRATLQGVVQLNGTTKPLVIEEGAVLKDCVLRN